MSKNKKRLGITKFIFIPIIFCVIMYLSVLAIFSADLTDIVSIGSMFLSDKQVDYSTAYENIFVPTNINSDTVNAEDVEYPSINKQFGELKINNRDVSAKLFFGDGTIPLNNGVGVYAGSFIPGYGKTILVAGHNNTYFNGLKKVKTGDIVTVNTSYGNYEYEITGTKIAGKNDKSAYDLSAEEENLVMYTCYPFDELGLTEQRYFVYAKKITGPEIVGLYE